MGDYLRLVLTNRGGEQFDFGTNKQNLVKTLGNNVSYLQREEKINANDSNSATYVFLETGSAPHRIEKKYRLPLVLFYNGMPPGGVLYVPFALPQLIYREDYDGSFTVFGEEKSTPMEVLTDMDSVVSAEFKAKLPGEIAKALIQTVLAIASQVAIEEATKDQQQDNLGVFLLATVAKVAQRRLLLRQMIDHGIPCQNKFWFRKCPLPKMESFQFVQAQVLKFLSKSTPTTRPTLFT